MPAPPPPRVPLTERLTADGGQGWIGKLLAVAGVAVTLVGVVLLLVLAAQAGILRPEIRVAAGGVLAAGLVGVAVRWNRRAGGRTGAIALAATGVAAAYIDVVAVTTLYEWVAPAVGLLLAAVDRRRRTDPCAALGQSAPRAVGAGSPADPGPDRRRRDLTADDRFHARAVGGRAACATRQGLDLAAWRPDGRGDRSAADRPDRHILRFGRGPVAARRCLWRGGAAGRRRRADPVCRQRRTGWRWRC